MINLYKNSHTAQVDLYQKELLIGAGWSTEEKPVEVEEEVETPETEAGILQKAEVAVKTPEVEAETPKPTAKPTAKAKTAKAKTVVKPRTRK